MEAATPQESHPDITMYRGPGLGLDLDKFAYFMLSLAWRGAVHSWEKQEGGSTKLLQLGAYEEPIRKYLYGSGPFPDDTAVIVIVCTDKSAREMWFLPEQFEEEGCINIRFQAMGVYFRAMMGQQLPAQFRRACCRSAGKWIHLGDCAHRIKEASESLEGPKTMSTPTGMKDPTPIDHEERLKHFQTINSGNVTNIINILMTLAVGVTAFAVNILITSPAKIEPTAAHWLIASFVWFFADILAGIALLFTRLEDVRRTIKAVVLARDHQGEVTDVKLQKEAIALRTTANRLNAATNILLYVQPTLFMFGFMCLSVSVFLMHGSKVG